MSELRRFYDYLYETCEDGFSVVVELPVRSAIEQDLGQFGAVRLTTVSMHIGTPERLMALFDFMTNQNGSVTTLQWYTPAMDTSVLISFRRKTIDVDTDTPAFYQRVVDYCARHRYQCIFHASPTEPAAGGQN